MSVNLRSLCIALALCFPLVHESNGQDVNLVEAIDAYDKGDYATAAKGFLAAAKGGDPNAMYIMGTLYENGEGVPKSAPEALRWFRLAAGYGSTPAMAAIGSAYRDGSGVQKNQSEAIKWFEKAAALNDKGAAFALGLSYANGLGVEKDYSKAAAWFKKAALLGDFWSMYTLGGLYEHGQGIEQNKVSAYAWFNIASASTTARANRDLAIYSRDRVEKQLSPSELVRAQKESLQLQTHIKARDITDDKKSVVSG